MAGPPPTPPTLAEVFLDAAADGAATGFALARLPQGEGRGRPTLLWVQDRLSRREGGRPCAAGLAGLPGVPPDLLHLEVPRAADVLWAMEEGLGCRVLCAVVGEVWGDPAALDFTATKRLALRAERGGVRAWLLRRAATPDLGAARERWRVASLPSPPHPDDFRAPGAPLWSAALFRARAGRTGRWAARRDLVAGGLVFHAADATDARAAGGGSQAA